ncbi:hypothetical protein PR202_ga20684 [Eleusine coracana subsp. coracana]|uniref:Uncharacterized protein n=1 Tax=Eleusine coracana subsp. coracana TaxID=191504 RepID=A0AAV5CYX2_ELECO|nr:hypothetical protein PR202_ga20684 [Eleusine coracana subsp. coracana]
MWRGRKEAKGGHCLIVWPKVTRPKELGGLGISDLQRLSVAFEKPCGYVPWFAICDE